MASRGSAPQRPLQDLPWLNQRFLPSHEQASLMLDHLNLALAMRLLGPVGHYQTWGTDWKSINALRRALLLFVEPWNHHVNKPELASWRMRGQVEGNQGTQANNPLTACPVNGATPDHLATRYPQTQMRTPTFHTQGRHLTWLNLALALRDLLCSEISWDTGQVVSIIKCWVTVTSIWNALGSTRDLISLWGPRTTGWKVSHQMKPRTSRRPLAAQK